MFPAIFVSHGAPTLALEPSPAREFLKGLGRMLPKPRAVLAISAHWETEAPAVNSVAMNDTIHDFYGFPEALYKMTYPAPGSPELAERTGKVLADAGYDVSVDTSRGLDHGAWVPMLLMYPDADIPVVQLSIQTRLGPEHHFKLGRALKRLRNDVLVFGTGGFVHNLRTLSRGEIDAPEPAWAAAFADWVHAAISEGRVADLINYRGSAPNAAMAHPTEDHFLPLFVTLGAGGEGASAQRLHASTTYGSLRMDSYSFA